VHGILGDERVGQFEMEVGQAHGGGW